MTQTIQLPSSYFSLFSLCPNSLSFGFIFHCRAQSRRLPLFLSASSSGVNGELLFQLVLLLSFFVHLLRLVSWFLKSEVGRALFQPGIDIFHLRQRLQTRYSVNMARLIVPHDEHYPGRTSQRTSPVIGKLKGKFSVMRLLDRAENCPFKQFFNTPQLKVSGVLIHQLLLRKVKSKNPNEILFSIGGKILRFGLLEFALITGLGFLEYPAAERTQELSQSRRLLDKYFLDATPKLIDLEDAFLSCTVTEDCWKLGLCYFVCSVLLTDEPGSKMNVDFLSFVEDEEFFFQYPWGMESFMKTLGGINKDMVHYRRLYLEQVARKKKKPEAKYAIYGYFQAFQYWAYEAIPKIGSSFASFDAVKYPRMLSWSSDKAPSAKDLTQLLSRNDLALESTLAPRPEELAEYESIKNRWLTIVEMEIDEGEEPEQQPEPEEAEGEGSSAAQPGGTSSIGLLHRLHARMDIMEANVDNLTVDIAEIKANQQTIINLLTHRV